MKKCLLTIFACIIIANVFSQNLQEQDLSKEYFLQKSKNNKTVARILLGAGLGMTVWGASINLSQPWYIFSNNHSNASKGMGLFYTGIACSLASIPFYIEAHHNKKTAALIKINARNIPYQMMNTISLKPQAELVLKIDL